MKKLKRGLASMLAALMLVTALPVTALAEEDSGGEAGEEITVQAPSQEENREEEDAGDLEEPAEPEKISEVLEPDTAEAADDADAIVEEEPDADYAAGEPEEEAEYALTEIGVWVGDEYIQAVEANDGIAMLSLLPLEEIHYSLDMTGYLPEELKEVKISTVLENLTGGQTVDASESDVAVWAKWYYTDENGKSVYRNDDYTIVDENMTVDLSDFYDYASSNYSTDSFTLELLAGKADQLDSSNQRYIVNVVVSSSPLEFAAKGSVTLVEWDRNRFYSRTEREYYSEYYLTVNPTTWDGEAPFAVVATLNEALAATGGMSVKFYEGYHKTAAEAERSTEITNQLYGENAAGYSQNYSEGQPENMPAVTAVFQRNGNTIAFPFYITAYLARDYSYMDDLYRPYNSSDYVRYERVSRRETSEEDSTTNVQMRKYELNSPDLPANGTYYARAYFYHYNQYVQENEISQYVRHTAAGYYTTAAAAEAQQDITSQLFGDGYPADYSGNGRIFTVVHTDGTVEHLGAIAVAYVPDENEASNQTGFTIYGANRESGTNSYAAYQISSGDDSYASHYQTVFLMNYGSYGEPMTPVTETEIYPTFSVHSRARVDAVQNGKDLGRQTSGESMIDFRSGEAVQYTVYAENNAAHDNYFVTFITQQKGAKLFVNAQNNIDAQNNEPYREIHLDTADAYHDVLLANTGDEELTGLYVKLEGADNLELDPYWTIGGDSAGTLAPLTTTNSRTPGGSYASYGELSNLAKIRLRPKLDANGEVMTGLVDGYLTIGSANGGEVKIKLSGTTGKLVITNTDLVDGVQYVPYSSGIRTNCINANNNLTYSWVSGDTLPSPLFVNSETGEIYGVPRSFGQFTFTVQVQYKNIAGMSEETRERMTATAEFTLVIKENLDDNVWNATDMGYQITDTLGIETSSNHYVWSSSSNDTVFTSNGEFNCFIALYLDGDLLTPDEDYTAESGSTVATLKAQTLQDKGAGNHTLAMEFREGDRTNGTLKRAAQNVEVKIVNNTTGGGSSSGSKRKKPGSTTTTTAPAAPSAPETTPAAPDTQSAQPTPGTGLPFTDVTASSWFLDDVKWVSEQGLMTGVSSSSFSPDTPISQAAIAVVLARLAKVDLTRFASFSDDVIQAGQWYTAAAIWAKQSGLLPDHTTFTGDEPITRDQMAIMLMKYLQSMGKDVTPPAQPVVFADAAQMSQDGNNAFQVLYRYNIFKGVGDNRMDPSGTTTRAQFSALVHRISDMT